GVDRGDAVHRLNLRLADDPGHGRALLFGMVARGQLSHLGPAGTLLLGHGTGVPLWRVLGLVIVVVVIALIGLGESEVLHGLAKRPSHVCELLGASVCGRSRNYRCSGREPRIAVPTRRCVAPEATANSRSPLIPADRIVAPGWL